MDGPRHGTLNKTPQPPRRNGNRWIRRLANFGLLVCLSAVVGLLPATGREIVIQHFDERVVIGADGTTEVTETIEAEFIGENWHGIFRTIPVEYTTPQRINYTLFLELISVTDEGGQPLRYERSRRGRDIKFNIYVANPDNATRTVILRYRVLNAVTYFEDHDELYWNITGNDWDATIQRVTAEIELPAGVTGLHAVSYSGAMGSRSQDAEVESRSNAVEFRTTRALEAHEGLTAVVGWNEGFVREPNVVQKAWFVLRSNWALVIPVGVFVLMFCWWWVSGRDPARDAITVQYEPPDNLSPAECGTLVDNKVAMRDVAATLVDLAVNGYMTIEHQKNDVSLGIMSDYIFHLKKPAGEWESLKTHEKQMLRGIFMNESPLAMMAEAVQDFMKYIPAGSPLRARAEMMNMAAQNPAVAKEIAPVLRAMLQSGNEPSPKAALSDLQNRFSLHLPLIRRSIFTALKNAGYYLHRPDQFRPAIGVLGVLVGFLMLPVGVGLAVWTGTSPLPWIASAILSGIIIVVFARFMSGRTAKGARTYAKVLGFEEFLTRAEKDQIARLDNAPELFEKYLPYAMALQVEKSWVQAFASIGMPAPQWYQGSYDDGFRPSLLVNDLGVMSSRAGGVMSSSARSGSDHGSSSSGATSGSGFSDSGSSGGGFGGGGGGGF